MVKKGEFGYIAKRKKRTIVMSFMILLIAVIIFVAGLLLNKMSKANIFTILAVLCVLPWAKQIVALVVLFPYHSVSRERYEKVKTAVKGRIDGDTDSDDPEPVRLYTDLVITSSEKIMNLDFVVVGYGQVIALVGKKGQDVAYIRQYLSKGVAQWGDYKVKIVESEKLFLKDVEGLQPNQTNPEERENVNSYLRSLIV